MKKTVTVELEENEVLTATNTETGETRYLPKNFIELEDNHSLAIVEKESESVPKYFATEEGAAMYLYAQGRMIQANFKKVVRIIE